MGRYAARGKQYIVQLRAVAGGIVMQQLLYAPEVRDDQRRRASTRRRCKDTELGARQAAHRTDLVGGVRRHAVRGRRAHAHRGYRAAEGRGRADRDLAEVAGTGARSSISWRRCGRASRRPGAKRAKAKALQGPGGTRGRAQAPRGASRRRRSSPRPSRAARPRRRAARRVGLLHGGIPRTCAVSERLFAPRRRPSSSDFRAPSSAASSAPASCRRRAAAGGEYRFSFPDLVVLRTAQALTTAQVPPAPHRALAAPAARARCPRRCRSTACASRRSAMPWS